MNHKTVLVPLQSHFYVLDIMPVWSFQIKEHLLLSFPNTFTVKIFASSIRGDEIFTLGNWTDVYSESIFTPKSSTTTWGTCSSVKCIPMERELRFSFKKLKVEVTFNYFYLFYSVCCLPLESLKFLSLLHGGNGN